MATWFDYPTNFSNGTSVTGVGSLMQYANYASNGFLGYGFLLLIFSITFMVGAMTSSKKALLSASFVTFIFSIYFVRLGMINPIVVFILTVIVIAGVIGSYKEGAY